MIGGGGGIFDVAIDGEIVYSRADTGCFPTNEQIIPIVKGRTAS